MSHIKRWSVHYASKAGVPNKVRGRYTRDTFLLVKKSKNGFDEVCAGHILNLLETVNGKLTQHCTLCTHCT